MKTASSDEWRGAAHTPCDVLIVGAGPAGSAAARILSQAGVRVVLADQRPFPRDKVCGDGLIADSLSALSALGVRDRVLSQSVFANGLEVIAPSGGRVRLAGEFACIPRRRLDAILCDAAQEAGARFVPGLTAVAPLEGADGVEGVRFKTADGRVDIRAAVTVLATGANAAMLNAFGLGASMRASAVAGRAYFEAPAELVAQFPRLTIAYDREWCPGYGWIFPSPGNRFNIGVGLFAGDTGGGRLHAFWEFFTSRVAPAAAIVRASRQVTAFRGAPLRTGLAGASFGRPGLLVAGEAASMTYAATGEGIGKAMESALIAAGMIVDALRDGRGVSAVHAAYEAEFRRRFGRRYNAYDVGQRFASHPRVLNLLAVRATRGRFVRDQLEALVAERGDASGLFSMRGIATALLR